LCVDHFWGINIGGICNLRLFFGEKKGKLIDDLWPIFNQKGIKILFLYGGALKDSNYNLVAHF
jgi:hypothetical protein